ncbi:hypothetical protein ACFLQK_00755 [bacterium]
MPDSVTPIGGTGIIDAIGITSDDNTCALTSGGKVKCWKGYYTNYSDLPVYVPGISDAVKISSGGNLMCAVIPGSDLECWGGNSPAPGFTGVVSMSIGGEHKCVALAGGETKCWGENEHGQLGNGLTEPSNLPVTVTY